jgi:purine catabolism regulator
VATPIVTRADEATRWLVLASPTSGFIGKLAKPAAEATAPLLAAMACLRDVVRDQEQAVKAALLEEALEPAASRDLVPLTARAAAFGLDFSRPARLVIARRHPRRAEARAPLDLARVRRELIAQVEHTHLPHLVHTGEDSIHALVQGGDAEVRVALTALSEALPDLVIGIGRAVDAIAQSHHSLRDAELAVVAAAWTRRGGSCASRTSTSAPFAVSEIPPERLGPKVDEILSVLRAHAPLYEALRAYFAHDLDVAATATALHMHRNSLRYRLARAEQLLGRSLKQPATIAAVYIALVAEAGEPVEAPKSAP